MTNDFFRWSPRTPTTGYFLATLQVAEVGFSPRRKRLGYRKVSSRQQVRITKSVTFHDLSLLNAHRFFKHRSVEGERMKLAPLATGIDIVRQISQKLFVEFTSGKAEGQLLRIHTGDDGAQAVRNHFRRQTISRHQPERKERSDSGAGQFRFSIFFYVCEKQVAEGDAFNAVTLRLVNKFPHRRFVLSIGARTGQVDDLHRQTQS